MATRKTILSATFPPDVIAQVDGARGPDSRSSWLVDAARFRLRMSEAEEASYRERVEEHVDRGVALGGTLTAGDMGPPIYYSVGVTLDRVGTREEKEARSIAERALGDDEPSREVPAGTRTAAAFRCPRVGCDYESADPDARCPSHGYGVR